MTPLAASRCAMVVVFDLTMSHRVTLFNGVWLLCWVTCEFGCCLKHEVRNKSNRKCIGVLLVLCNKYLALNTLHCKVSGNLWTKHWKMWKHKTIIPIFDFPSTIYLKGNTPVRGIFKTLEHIWSFSSVLLETFTCLN